MAAFLQTCMVLGALAPLASFAWIVLRQMPLERRARAGQNADAPAAGEPLAGYIATAAVGVSLALSIIVLIVWASAGVELRGAWARAASEGAVTWLNLGGVPVKLGVKLDSLTIIMSVMIALCDGCVHVFSLGYMRRDTGFARYFAFLSLFSFAMLGLVMSVDLLVLFVFWELVGVCSYFLIGFWFEKKSATNAAIKAFVVNRVGDFGFIVGLGLCLAYLGTLSLDAAPLAFESGAHAKANSPEPAAKLFSTTFAGVSLATWLGVALFCGAVGKSAQFPLHVWLPDAMEGPTPVSALIHAATMVAAGVYLVARVFPLLTVEAQHVIAVVGCITLTIAALMALVQTDIKRLLAYSTVSQLGYMMFGLGVGAWTGSVFHLFVHAFFKALLFLAAGQVLAACQGESDIRRLGGLARKMPRTAVTFLIAVLAASDFGIPWTALGIGGFYSKDEILAVAFQRSGSDGSGSSLAPLSWVLVMLPLLVAYLTPFYMGRCFVLTFLGRTRDERLQRPARESPLLYGPLLVLGAMTLVSGWFLFRPLVAQASPSRTGLVTLVDGHDGQTLRAAHTWLPLLTGFAWAIGLGAAYVIYRDGMAKAERIRRMRFVAPLVAIVENRFYVDALYDAVVVRGTRIVAAACRLLDEWVLDVFVSTLARVTERIGRFAGTVLDDIAIDGTANAVGGASWRLGGVLRGLQTGLIRNYVLLAVTGVVGVLIFVITNHGLDWALLVVLACVAAIATPWHKIRQIG